MSFDLWHTADPDAEAPAVTLDPPADGVYEVALTDAAAFNGKDERPWVAMTFKDMASEYSWKVLHGFKSQGQANMTKKACRELGVLIDQITSQEQLDEALKSCVGGYYAVTVKTNGNFRNTYVDGPTSSTPPPAGDFPAAPAPAAPEATDDASIPF